MRLAIVIPGFQADEGDWCIPAFTNLARELARSVEVHVFALRYPHKRASYKVGRVYVYALGGGAFRGRRLFGVSLLNLWRDALRKVQAVHRRRPFDAIMGIWATESGWLATRVATMLGVPSLVHLAGGELVWLPQIGYGSRPGRLPATLVRSTLRKANLVTVPSSPIGDALSKTGLIGQERVRRWSLGVDTEMFTPALRLTERTRPFTFISVGSLIPVKGYDFLLRSFALLAEYRGSTAARLVIAGSGPLDGDLRRLMMELGLEGYVYFLGGVAHDQLPSLYHNADCFVIGSWHEAQCMAALEAMACGLPWIAPPVGSLADLPSRESGVPTGMRVEGRDIEQFARAMHDMRLLPPEERARWAMNARRAIEQEFSLTIQTVRLLEKTLAFGTPLDNATELC